MTRLADDLEFAKGLARAAAAIALERRNRLVSSEKVNRSFVTDLDVDLEAEIRRRIAQAYPDDQLTGEELAPTGGSGPRHWSIDPIDGTGNLVHGLPLWSISIGLIDGGEPVLGVIAVPPLGELYWAAKGTGAWRDHEPIRAVDAGGFHMHDNVSLSTNALRVLDPRSVPGRIRDIGTACTELAFVSCGRFRASVFLGEQRHDVAAGAVIAAEAGCWFGTLDGQLLTLGAFVAQTPVRVPTIIAPPMRLERLTTLLRRLEPGVP
jgi:fructose-1,6-bisphosphatase/inositol monophosphatase family enzyme